MAARIQVKDFRITPLDPPLSTFIPDRAEWWVENVSDKDLADRKGSEVHRFGHWTQPNIYVRIVPPTKEKP